MTAADRRAEPGWEQASRRRRKPFGLALVLLAACSAPPSPSGPVRVVVLHTNDLHGAAHPTRTGTGGFPALAALIRKVRAEETARGARVLVVDCGDFFQGTPEGDLTRGKLVVEVMNAIGYDALCLGNHDFDLGPKAAEELASLARFPFLSANVLTKGGRDPPAWLRPSLRFPELGLEMLALTTSEIEKLTLPAAREGLEFEVEDEALRRHGWDRPAPVARVLLTHVGLRRERELAERYPIDALLGGHSHSRREEKIGRVAYLQSGAHGQLVGRLDLEIDRSTGRVTRSSTALLPVRVAEGEDPEVKAILSRYSPDIDRVMNEVVGELAVDLPKDFAGRSSPLGNYLTDLMREATGADLALHNRTGIRASMARGPVRLRDVYMVSPFRNTVVTMKLPGKDLLDLLGGSLLEGVRFLEMSGGEIVYEEKRLVEARVAGVPIDPARDYVVATNSFLAVGGDGQAAFTRGREVKDTLLDLMELHQQDLKKNPSRSHARADRIRPR